MAASGVSALASGACAACGACVGGARGATGAGRLWALERSAALTLSRESTASRVRLELSDIHIYIYRLCRQARQTGVASAGGALASLPDFLLRVTSLSDSAGRSHSHAWVNADCSLNGKLPPPREPPRSERSAPNQLLPHQLELCLVRHGMCTVCARLVGACARTCGMCVVPTGMCVACAPKTYREYAAGSRRA